MFSILKRFTQRHLNCTPQYTSSESGKVLQSILIIFFACSWMDLYMCMYVLHCFYRNRAEPEISVTAFKQAARRSRCWSRRETRQALSRYLHLVTHLWRHDVNKKYRLLSCSSSSHAFAHRRLQKGFHTWLQRGMTLYDVSKDCVVFYFAK